MQSVVDAMKRKLWYPWLWAITITMEAVVYASRRSMHAPETSHQIQGHPRVSIEQSFCLGVNPRGAAPDFVTTSLVVHNLECTGYWHGGSRD